MRPSFSRSFCIFSLVLGLPNIAIASPTVLDDGELANIRGGVVTAENLSPSPSSSTTYVDNDNPVFSFGIHSTVNTNELELYSYAGNNSNSDNKTGGYIVQTPYSTRPGESGERRGWISSRTIEWPLGTRGRNLSFKYCNTDGNCNHVVSGDVANRKIGVNLNVKVTGVKTYNVLDGTYRTNVSHLEARSFFDTTKDTLNWSHTMDEILSQCGVDQRWQFRHLGQAAHIDATMRSGCTELVISRYVNDGPVYSCNDGSELDASAYFRSKADQYDGTVDDLNVFFVRSIESASAIAWPGLNVIVIRESGLDAPHAAARTLAHEFTHTRGIRGHLDTANTEEAPTGTPDDFPDSCVHDDSLVLSPAGYVFQDNKYVYCNSGTSGAEEPSDVCSTDKPYFGSRPLMCSGGGTVLSQKECEFISTGAYGNNLHNRNLR